MKYEIGIFVKDWEEDSEESKDYQNLACRTGIRQLILCRGVYTFYFLCFLWSTYHKHSDTFQICTFEMDIYSYFLNRENGSDYLTSYISYDHVNFIVPEHKRYELMDN